MSPDPQHLEIRKYPNRRYYDVTRSRHLTLEDIRQLVREGYDIRVTDSKSSADITAKVLAQIILELEEEKIGTFPVALLTRMIRVNDQVVKDFVETYFNQAFASFMQYRQQFDEYLKRAPGWAGFGAAGMPWGRPLFDPFGRGAASAGAASTGGGGAASGGGSGPEAELRTRLESLQAEVEALRSQVGGESRRRPASRSKPGRSASAQKTS